MDLGVLCENLGSYGRLFGGNFIGLDVCEQRVSSHVVQFLTNKSIIHYYKNHCILWGRLNLFCPIVDSLSYCLCSFCICNGRR